MKHCYFNYNDKIYSLFMIDIMKSLTPIRLDPSVRIHSELDEVEEIIFVESGIYNVGFHMNKKDFFVLRVFASTIIGGFECSM